MAAIKITVSLDGCTGIGPGKKPDLIEIEVPIPDRALGGYEYRGLVETVADKTVDVVTAVRRPIWDEVDDVDAVEDAASAPQETEQAA